jgi:hypothetical protein
MYDLVDGFMCSDGLFTIFGDQKTKRKAGNGAGDEIYGAKDSRVVQCGLFVNPDPRTRLSTNEIPETSIP